MKELEKQRPNQPGIKTYSDIPARAAHDEMLWVSHGNKRVPLTHRKQAAPNDHTKSITLNFYKKRRIAGITQPVKTRTIRIQLPSVALYKRVIGQLFALLFRRTKRRNDTTMQAHRWVELRRRVNGSRTEYRLRLHVPRTFVWTRKAIHRYGVPKGIYWVATRYFRYIISNRSGWRRVGWAFMALLMMSMVVIDSVVTPKTTEARYNLSAKTQTLVGEARPVLAQSLRRDAKAYLYNEGYKPSTDVAGQTVGPKFSANFYTDASEGTVITDAVNDVSIQFKPDFALLDPMQDQNRLIYPILGRNAKKIYTLGAQGVKEDIVLKSMQGDAVEFSYDLGLPDGTEARMESDGSIGIYGVSTLLLGEVATGTDADADLLQRARQNGSKNELLFTLPAPFVQEFGKKTSAAKAWYTLDGSKLTLHASNLKKATYPLSIDPTVYIETAQKLMLGNNETNIDFDIDNELIQKSQTTGARIDDWTNTTNMNGAFWGNAVAATGGYVYAAGGNQSTTTSVAFDSGSHTFDVPTGVSSVIVKAWGGGGGGGGGGNGSSANGGDGAGGAFAQATLSVTPGETLNVNVGGGGVGGEYSSGGNDAGGGGGGGGYTAIFRSTTRLLVAAGGGGGGGARQARAGGDGGAGGGTNGIAGSNGYSATNGAGGGYGSQSNGGIGGAGGDSNKGANGTSLSGGAGADGRSGTTNTTGSGASGGINGGGNGGQANVNTTRAGGGGGGAGLYGGGGGGGTSSSTTASGGGGGGGSSMASGTSTTLLAGSGTTPGNSSDVDRNSAGQGGSGGPRSTDGSTGTDGRAVIIYLYGSGQNQKLYWAKFNNTTRAIDSPNPGNGTCSGWCSLDNYDLPDVRVGASMVAYNGFLYVIGGTNESGVRQSTIYVAKLGANGEPQLWHPSDTDKSHWGYWYTTNLNGNTAKSYLSAIAYKNRLYVIGGQTNASPGGVTTVEEADILPTGALGVWTTTGMQALPSGAGRSMLSVQQYNGVLYAMGGFEGAQTSSSNLRNAVYYSHLNDDGTMNAWQQTKSFSGARATFGGSYATIWGAYMYLGGGCSAVNSNGYCTAVASDTQIASINADGTLDKWTAISGLTNERIGYTLLGWQGGLYRFSGCESMNTSTGACNSILLDVDYGVINPAGEVSTVSITEPNGTAPCSGGSPYGCDLPPLGDNAGQGGQMLNESIILNGYLYVIGGCTNYACSQSSGNISYASISPDGLLEAPPSCSGTSYGAWCVDSTNRINGTSGVSAGGVTTFNNRIYVVGGIDETSSGTQRIYYNSVNANGSLTGAWNYVTLSSAGISGYSEISYTYAFTRANPSSASTYPGNLYILGGCSSFSASAGCSSSYATQVYKCNIATSGAISGCTTSGQLQIDTEFDTGGMQGLGLHSGTIYAGYVYLIGGYSDNVGDRDTVYYAKIDNSNNIVSADTGSASGNWILSDSHLSVGRRRGWAFGYNGHIYAVGGYDDSGTGIIPFIEWAKMDVSSGAIDAFVTSSVTINQRWGLSMVVSNSYAYVIGGCNVGASPSNCSSFEPSIQTFQLYNNDSGSVADFTAQADQSFQNDPNRWGARSAIVDGKLYVAGGCISADNCSAVTDDIEAASLSAADGSVGTWQSVGSLPAGRAWGSLKTIGSSLYYVGGIGGGSLVPQATVYYATASGGTLGSWAAATNGLPQARSNFGAAVWNDRIYVVGGKNSSGNTTATVYVSPQLTGGDVGSNWSSVAAFNVARSGVAVTAYANNLYLFGGYDGSNYLSDVQFTQINSDGTIDPWAYTRSLPGPIRNARAVSANGYIYLVGGRSADTTCSPKVLIAPISANTTIASGNNPTGVGEWYETNVRYSGDRYGAAVAYSNGKLYMMGGGCTAPLSSNQNYQSTVNSQPQVAEYSRLIDTDTDVFPTKWLLNGLDNSIGARWEVSYRSMHDLDTAVAPNEDCGTSLTMPTMTTWGQTTNFGDVTLGQPETYTAVNGSGGNIHCARYFYMDVHIDASKTFGYPEDVNRGPTITDLSLFFTADPSKRMIHGKTFTGGLQQPLDTPF
jgi:hypothetical protein